MAIAASCFLRLMSSSARRRSEDSRVRRVEVCGSPSCVEWPGVVKEVDEGAALCESREDCLEVDIDKGREGYFEASSRLMDVRGSENDLRESSFDLV